MSLPNLAALALAPSALGEDTTLMTQGWEELFEQLHDPRIPSEIADKIRKEAAPPPDPVPTIDIIIDTDHPTNTDALVILPLDATGMIKAELLMSHWFDDKVIQGYSTQFRRVNRLDFIFRLNSSTELAKKMQRYCDTFGVIASGVAGKHWAELRVTTTEEKWSIPANTTQIRFVFHHDKFADDDKLLRMFATVCPMTFGTMIAVLREEYGNPWKDTHTGPRATFLLSRGSSRESGKRG